MMFMIYKQNIDKNNNNKQKRIKTAHKNQNYLIYTFTK